MNIFHRGQRMVAKLGKDFLIRTKNDLMLGEKEIVHGKKEKE